MARTSAPNSAGAQYFFCAGASCSNLNSQGTYVTFGAGHQRARRAGEDPGTQRQREQRPRAAPRADSSLVKTVNITES